MAKSRKIQVTIDEERYQLLSEIAQREGKKLAAVVRESIEKYCLGPERESRQHQALQELFSIGPVPVPEDYNEWEKQYGDRKRKDRGS